MELNSRSVNVSRNKMN